MDNKANQLLKLYDQLQSDRKVLDNIWRDCYDMTFPLRGVQFYLNTLLTPQAAWNQARQKSAELFDTTGTNAVRLLASSLLSGLTPANSQWAGIEVHNSTNEERRWLEEASYLVWANIHSSNYNEVAFEGFIDAIVTGSFALFVADGEDRPFNFELWPLSSLYLSSSRRSGDIDTAFYKFALTNEQAISEYGVDCCKHVSAKAKDPLALTEFVQVLMPRDEVTVEQPLPVASYHICTKCKTVVREGGFEEMPLIVPRIMTIPGSVYSHGLVFEALPTLRSVNVLQRTILGCADMAVAGMWGAVDDGILNPKTVTVGPRKIITVASKDSLFPLTPNSDFTVAEWMLRNMQADIRRILLSDQLQANDGGPTMTATEVHARVNIIRQQLGPNYERLQDEFLRPLVIRCFGIMMRAGAFAEMPESLQGRLMHVKYLSPLARAQKMEEVQAIERYEGSLAQMAQFGHPEVMDVHNWDASAKRKALLISVPATLANDDKTVEGIRQARQEAIQQQQQQAIMAEGVVAGG